MAQAREPTKRLGPAVRVPCGENRPDPFHLFGTTTPAEDDRGCRVRAAEARSRHSYAGPTPTAPMCSRSFGVSLKAERSGNRAKLTLFGSGSSRCFSNAQSWISFCATAGSESSRSVRSLADQTPAPGHHCHRRRFEPMPPSALPAKSDARFDVDPREAPSPAFFGHLLHVRDRLLCRSCAVGAPRAANHVRRRGIPAMPRYSTATAST